MGMADVATVLFNRFIRVDPAYPRWPDLTDHVTYVFAGNGCLMEAISQEAIDLAGHLRLGRPIVPWDDNRINHRRQDGPVHQRRPEGALCRRALAYAGGGQA